MSSVPVPILTGDKAGPDHFKSEVAELHQPAVLRGLDLGPCTSLWRDPEYVKSHTDNMDVRVHATSDPLRMDFKSKNFEYKTTGFHDLIDKASRSDCDTTSPKYYLRSTSVEDVKSPVIFEKDFPRLAKDFQLPQGLVDPGRLFSSVFRVSAGGVRVWTHYDVMDNFYAQVVGRKEAILWAPDQALNLYLDGDKSRVIDIDDADSLSRTFPKFLRSERHVANLEPGDVLYIPALWFHNMTALDFGMAVNVFWKNLDPRPGVMYDKKDTYGNRDLLPGAKAVRMLDNVMKQLDDLPQDYRDFYARQLIARIEKKCLSKPLE